jgi:hypothetical protein
MPSPRTFKSVFTEERSYTNGLRQWRIKGSGVQGWPTDAPLTAEIKRFLETAGIAVRAHSMGSPANVDSYHLEAAFEDGGLYASTGTYWFGQRGAWIRGRKAVMWLAKQLGLCKIPEIPEENEPRIGGESQLG